MSIPITSVLVANRGEIARRVFRTARDMGMRCIAVFVDADARAPFVAEADAAIRLPKGGYLDGDAVIAAALSSGADGIHPGYGFLSENAGFARKVIASGIAWVGPSPAVIESMGDKLAAKRIAIEAGVPTLPSSDDPSRAEGVGFPLLVKAAAGGGGKGMRVVGSPAELVGAVAASQREARGAFGDDRVFLERYIRRSRHIEIQILGDEHGGLVHLGERECSIQRRHQKIIEESPSTAVDGALREKMGAAALSLASRLGYQSAGTVEFLLDDATGEFYFLEVNTRLQVEHPVTEEVTGIDLVREQLRVAAGEPLGYEQGSIAFTGHAIEARLYAEDPSAGFLPAAGTLSAYVEPHRPAVRWDSGVQAGSVVGVDFDPMLAKVIAHAPTRGEAAGRLGLALERLHLGGVVTNRAFLAATLRHPDFLAGATTTDFIERTALERASRVDAPEVERAAAAAALWIQGRNRRDDDVWAGLPSGWRNGPMPPQSVAFMHGTDEVVVDYHASRDGTVVLDARDGHEARYARIHEWRPDGIDIEIDGHRTDTRVTDSGERIHVQAPRGTLTFEVKARFVPPGGGEATGGLSAPMPGAVLEVRCEVGDTVAARQVLVVLEAMKMEHHVVAPFAGIVTEVRVAVGDQVDNGAVLLVIERPDEGGGK
ncbi:acetyl-CoA carboxylase biotin carboxylase subunit [Acidiferrimicrobium sp. IK]|uniref:acetyl/propionyl/methylcrotonyl-CoA carboxylase subunit alpha n=1 Tax=Acidiferrimicrobium sp. IK TaxID=2871700 RepID=UPI0021CB6163|nr:biotin carboxylase N-terminal domain-containing protein [Acidiferrimicrobium sp. IK]MCU4187407.1 acetyl-CoA carboxylase biotin carboxylase subunit [Acidiferrimicrobium sp. IK]